ncbi:DUF1707 domain-containing protein [Saccharopolyspora rhizosphaerae]|uniref:DUF1707 domain-containing protein n=1 Tax=Saccharopolyspora rhizosphaerae TaxID=2492662 RepID=A0A3R8P063_9PSEU|nr:DUF1707 domain-containing protein [Saccharopolyspora rhizosphaerae]RRO13641.1 DUF1707 domain-containing protein [Saccharopolyspora rhizosphaerae]
MVDPDEGRMRASDADRERVVERLRAALDEGRLSITEYDDRLRSAYGATTIGELEPLVEDLPEPEPSAEVAAREEHKATLSKEWRDWAGAAVVMIAIWGVTSVASGELAFFWPAFPIVIWAAVVVAMTIEGPRKRRD